MKAFSCRHGTAPGAPSEIAARADSLIPTPARSPASAAHLSGVEDRTAVGGGRNSECRR